MDNVTFDSEADLSRTIPAQSGTAGMAAWLISKKIAKDESQANFLLLGVLAACVLLTGFALANLFGANSNIDTAERIRLEQTTTVPR